MKDFLSLAGLSLLILVIMASMGTPSHFDRGMCRLYSPERAEYNQCIGDIIRQDKD